MKPMTETEEIKEVTPRNHRILITEDEGIVARDLKHRLQQLGYDVCGIASTASEAIAEAEKMKPDLALMDIRLRGKLDGVDAARHLRENLHIPVVFLSSYTDSQTVDRAREVTPQGYLVKPFDERTLDITVQMALQQHRQEHRLAIHDQELTAIMQHFNDGVIVADSKGFVLFMNPAAENMLGRKMEELKGAHVQSCLHFEEEESSPILGKAHFPYRRRFKRHQPRNSYCMLHSRSGRKIPVDVRIMMMKHDAGASGDMLVVLRDISQEHDSEMNLRFNEERLHLAVDYCQGAVWDIDFQQDLMHVSAGWQDLMDVPRDNTCIHLKHFGEFVYSEDRDDFADALVKHWDGQTPYFHLTHRILTKTGDSKWVHSRGIAVKDRKGTLYRMVGTTVELSDLEVKLKDGEEPMDHGAEDDSDSSAKTS